MLVGVSEADVLELSVKVPVEGAFAPVVGGNMSCLGLLCLVGMCMQMCGVVAWNFRDRQVS